MKKSRGFTLIETVMYIALFSIIIGGALVALDGIMHGNQVAGESDALIEESNFVMGKIGWALASADSFTDTSTMLTIINNSVPADQNRLVFDAADNTIELKRYDNSSGALLRAGALTSNNTIVSRLLFTDIPATGGASHGVTISFHMASVTASRSEDFSNTFYLKQ